MRRIEAFYSLTRFWFRKVAFCVILGLALLGWIFADFRPENGKNDKWHGNANRFSHKQGPVPTWQVFVRGFMHTRKMCENGTA